MTIHDMTQQKWSLLDHTQREAIRDYSGLTPQLKGLEGWRVAVVDCHVDDEEPVERRFIVGMSTGWRPCHLEISRRSAHGGGCACQSYKSVRKLYKVR